MLLNRARPSGRAQPRIGRRQRRPRAARASGAGADRRRIGDGWRRSGDPGRSRPRSRAPGWSRWLSQPKEGLALINGTQASAAVGALALARRGAARARGRHRRRAVDRRPPRLVSPVRSARCTTRDRTRASARRPTICCGCCRTARSTDRTRTAAACRTPTRCAARRRCTARRATRSRYARSTLEIEANAATDNPMVFARDGEIVSGGNFHGAPIAIAADVHRARRCSSSPRSRSGDPIAWSTRR